MKVERDAREALRDWIRRHGRMTDPAQLTDDTPLVEGGILSSLQVLDLLLLLEELRGAPVDVTRLQPGAFHDIDAIVAGFLEDRP